MSSYGTTTIYAYGVLMPFSSLANEKAAVLLAPYFGEWLEEEGMEDEYEGVDLKDGKRVLEIMSGILGDFSELLENCFYDKFPLLFSFPDILDGKNGDKNILICVEQNVLYLEWEKIENRVEPTNEENAQLEELLSAIGFEGKPEWNNFSYHNTP